MSGWLSIPPWPPELEPGETVLLEGRSSPRRLWAWTGSMVAFGCVLAIALDAALGGIPAAPLPAMLTGAAAAIARSATALVLVVAVFHWQFVATGGGC